DQPKILCVDDTPEARMLVRRLLSSRYHVLEAKDGLQGIEVAKETSPDLVLVDLHMPHLSGYEVATRIKSLMPQVPVVALTADVTTGVQKRVLAAGCDGYISKPIDPDTLEEQIESYLAGKRQELKDDGYRQAYQQMLVARMENKVRELTQALDRNAELDKQNLKLLEETQRQARLLKAGAEVGRSITSILDLDTLLRTTVDTICDEFGFYYAGVFLVDDADSAESGEEWAVLRAGRGEAGDAMVAAGHKLRVDGHSMIGAATGQRKAHIALDVGEEPFHFKNPHLPDTHSEIALPLIAGGRVIGALTVQSTAEAAFTSDDASTLQAMADQLAIAINNAQLHQQNQQLLVQADRRAQLLEAAALVGREFTSILDLDELLNKTVDIICAAYGFYYAGVFLVDDADSAKSGEEWAVLRAGQGKAGAAMLSAGHRLKVGGLSMIGDAISQQQARIALDVGEETVFFKNPHLPDTRSEMALPLIVGGEAIGALTIQSTQEAAFNNDDITALQAMADQLAVTINNARLLKDLGTAHAELVRTKTYQAIAEATGESIHWVGNKAAPIPGSVARISEDVIRYLAMANALLADAAPELREHKFAQMLAEAAEEIADRGTFLTDIQAELEAQSLKRLRRMLSVESIFEDLAIIESSARSILNIKEDLIGPARQRNLEVVSLPELLEETIAAMGIPDEVVRTLFASDLRPVWADRRQLGRVFTNLIKNGMEAMHEVKDKKLFLWARMADEPGFAVVDVIDHGAGIPPDQVDKIWMAFYTTKGDRGGTGLGLPACAQIVGQLEGKITVESDAGLGTTFSVFLPVLENTGDDISDERTG
ncbi:MAG TPA: GAF domain-containing protein, partial [Thermoflexia bacterium]|nr:GAF domain-containing protein [Thermoflexia bacterium]